MPVKKQGKFFNDFANIRKTENQSQGERDDNSSD